METKNKVGVIVILGGIDLIGIYLFIKNKSNVNLTQLKGLQDLSNYYKTGSGEDVKLTTGQTQAIKPCRGIIIGGICQSLLANVDYTKMTPKEIEALKQSIGTIPDPSTLIPNQIAQNMQNADFTNWNLGLNIPTKL
jgi:hypothetical protein